MPPTFLLGILQSTTLPRSGHMLVDTLFLCWQIYLLDLIQCRQQTPSSHCGAGMVLYVHQMFIYVTYSLTTRFQCDQLCGDIGPEFHRFPECREGTQWYCHRLEYSICNFGPS